MPRLGRAALALLLAACGPGKQSTSSDSETTSSGTTTTDIPTSSDDSDPTDAPATCPDHPATDACCCFEDYQSPELPGVRTTTQSVCGVQPLCPPFHFQCDDPSNPALPCPRDPFSMEDVTALACALQALADGESGRIEWNFGNGFDHTFVFLDLVGDGTAFRQGYHHFDLCFDTHAVQHLTLPPPAYFAKCLEAPDWQSRFPCLRDAPFGEPLAICLPGGDYSGADNQC